MALGQLHGKEVENSAQTCVAVSKRIQKSITFKQLEFAMELPDAAPGIYTTLVCM